MSSDFINKYPPTGYIFILSCGILNSFPALYWSLFNVERIFSIVTHVGQFSTEFVLLTFSLLMLTGKNIDLCRI